MMVMTLVIAMGLGWGDWVMMGNEEIGNGKSEIGNRKWIVSIPIIIFIYYFFYFCF